MNTVPKPEQIAAQHGYNCAGFVLELFEGCEFFMPQCELPFESIRVEEVVNRWVTLGIMGRVLEIVSDKAGMIELVYALSDGSTRAVSWPRTMTLWMKIPTNSSERV